MPLYENSLKPIFTKDKKFWSNAFNVSCTRTVFDSILTIQQSVQRSWSFLCTNICIYHVNLNKLLNFNSISPEVRTPWDLPRTQILPGFSTQGRAAHISESATFYEKDRITRSGVFVPMSILTELRNGNLFTEAPGKDKENFLYNKTGIIFILFETF